MCVRPPKVDSVVSPAAGSDLPGSGVVVPPATPLPASELATPAKPPPDLSFPPRPAHRRPPTASFPHAYRRPHRARPPRTRRLAFRPGSRPDCPVRPHSRSRSHGGSFTHRPAPPRCLMAVCHPGRRQKRQCLDRFGKPSRRLFLAGRRYCRQCPHPLRLPCPGCRFPGADVGTLGDGTPPARVGRSGPGGPRRYARLRSAGAASFRRRETLERLLQEALAEVQRLLLQPNAPETEEQSKLSLQQRGAQRRHAAERVERIQRALQRMPEMEAKKEKAKKKKSKNKGGENAAKKEAARVSTTDAEATVMKMADGGFRPAYNVQLSTACRGQVIVGVDVVTEGTDQGQLPPMLEQIEERFGERPKDALVDGGFTNHDDIEAVQQGTKGCKVDMCQTSRACSCNCRSSSRMRSRSSSWSAAIRLRSSLRSLRQTWLFSSQSLSRAWRMSFSSCKLATAVRRAASS